MGAVFLAIDAELNREVALKQILENHADDPGSRQRFLLEAEITGGLEHPGIVPVYGLGTYDDGRPYYAMRFIRGDSLKEAIARFHAGQPAGGPSKALEFRQLLRRFVDVCNALEYAHARGVLHRDIKPANIILGRYGETLVVDWGLAKATGRNDPDRDEAVLVPSSASGSAETLPGSALGTPAYMSPEQARGDLESLGPRSDVYALGATLFSLLTGRAPFQGQRMLEVLEQARKGEFPAPRSIAPSIDPALESIALKAMAREPGDRYPSCRALAEEVDRWLADERVEAYPEPWTRTLGRWLSRHRTIVSGAAAAASVAVVSLAMLAAMQSAARDALDRKNRELDGKNIELTDANDSLARQYARVEDRERQAIEAVRRFGDAVANHPQLKGGPSLEGLRKVLLKEPIAFFRALRGRLLDDRETRPESMERLAAACQDLGTLTANIGDARDALASYEEALAIRRQLADPAPEVASALAETLDDVAQLRGELGRVDGARAAFEEAGSIREKLVTDHPDRPIFRRELASHLNSEAELLGDIGQPDRAEALYERARTILQGLIDDQAPVPDLERFLAGTRYNQGVIQASIGRTDDAIRSHEEALAIRRKLADSAPDDGVLRDELAQSSYGVAYLRAATGRADEALQAYEQARALLGTLVRDNPSVVRFQQTMAMACNNLGVIQAARNQPAAAFRLHAEALAIRDRLARDNPGVPQYRRDLAGSHGRMGSLLNRMGRTDEAIRAHEEARAILDRLVHDNPSVVQYRRDLADACNELGTEQTSAGQAEAAERSLEQARSIWADLAREHPEMPDIASSLGGTLSNLALVDAGRKRFADAYDKLEEAISWQRKALAANPREPQYRRFMANHLQGRIAMARNLGREAEAAEARRELQALLANDPADRAIDARLAAVLGGEPPADNAERIALARRAHTVRQYFAATKLWSEAFSADPGLLDDRTAQHRYHAARSASMAANSVDEASPAGAPRAFRARAYRWLADELAAWSSALEGADAATRSRAADALALWQASLDLAGVRDPEALAALPDAERLAWQAFWIGVDATRKRAEAD
ncbi:MAG: serine/threonine-protein kinase [Isosphaeraceae bacterium]